MDELEEITESITFRVTPTMKKQIDKLMENKRWKLSAFIRVAIKRELERLTNGV